MVLQALQQAKLKHKHTGDSEALRELTDLRELFIRLLDRHTRKKMRYMSHKYYDRGNKCG